MKRGCRRRTSTARPRSSRWRGKQRREGERDFDRKERALKGSRVLCGACLRKSQCPTQDVRNDDSEEEENEEELEEQDDLEGRGSPSSGDRTEMWTLEKRAHGKGAGRRDRGRCDLE